MPSTRYLKDLIDSGWLGRPYHMHMRYYAAFARTPGIYLWRFDKKLSGSGALADIGSHFLHLAEWFYGPIEAVTAQLGVFIERAPLDLNGQPYEQADDSAMVMLRFKNGAQGLVHASAIAYEKTYADHGYGFDQVHEWDFHGSAGTLRQVIDWDFRQHIIGDRPGDGPERQLLVPDKYWGDKRRDYVIETWEDTFRKEGCMTQEFVRRSRWPADETLPCRRRSLSAPAGCSSAKRNYRRMGENSVIVAALQPTIFFLNRISPRKGGVGVKPRHLHYPFLPVEIR